MKKTYTHIILPLLLLSLISCLNHSEAWNSLDAAESLMESRPDSALGILSSINAENLSGKHEKARMALLMSMALDKNYVDTTDFKVLQPAIDYYLKHGTPKEKLQTYYYQGRIYQNAGDNGNAMHAFLLGERVARAKAALPDTLTFARLLSAKAIILKESYDFESCMTLSLEAARCFRDKRMSYSYHECLLDALTESVLAGNRQYADSIANVCKRLNQDGLLAFEDFFPVYLTFLNEFGSKSELVQFLQKVEKANKNSSNSRLNIADAYINLNNPQKAIEILGQLNFSNLDENKTKYAAIMVAAYESLGDYRQAFEWLKEFETLLFEENSAVYKNKLQTSKDRYNEDIAAQMLARQKDQILWITILIIFLLIAAIVSAFYIVKYYKIKRQSALQETENLRLANKILKANRDKAEADIKIKTLEAENLRHRIEELENEKENLTDALNRKGLSEEVKQAIRTRIEMLNSLIASDISKDYSHEKLYENWIKHTLPDIEGFMNSNRLAFTASHPEFIKFLEQHSLTIEEINYVCLYAIGLKGTDVGKYMNRAGHINMSSTIRKKLGLTIHDTQIKKYIMARFKDPSLLTTNETEDTTE